MRRKDRTEPSTPRPRTRTPLLVFLSAAAMAAGLVCGNALPAQAAASASGAPSPTTTATASTGASPSASPSTPGTSPSSTASGSPSPQPAKSSPAAKPSQTTKTQAPVATHPAADGALTFTFDPGLALDPTVTQGLIKKAESENPRLSQTIEREAEEFSLGSNDNVVQAPSFDGTLSITPDGTGVSLTVPAAQAQTSATWQESAFAYATGWLAGLVVDARCTAAVPGSAVVCASVGGLYGSLIRGLFVQDFDNGSAASADSAASLTGFQSALKNAAWGVRQTAVLQWIRTSFGAIATGTGTALKAQTWPWAQSAQPSVRGVIQDAGTQVPSDVAAWGTHPAKAANAIKANTSTLPCDVYEAYGTPCVAAYSMDRAMYADYDGPLYQVQRASDSATAEIGLLSTGGYVNAAQQNSFCSGTTCTITEIYDQSPELNDLSIEGSGGAASADHGANASALPITIDGNAAYGLDVTGQIGYRDDTTQGIAVNGEAEGMYMVASGTNVNSGCCFDFGNAETNNHDNGAGHMDAVNFGTFCGSYESPCSGSGPWVEADMENGQYLGGDGSNPNDTSISDPFVTAVLKNNGQNTFELEGGNAQSGGLTSYWDGSLPSGYSPMHQEGAIVLGTGGDNSNSDVGSFFEGVMTQGFPSNTADAAVQAGIVSADYAGYTGGATGTGGTAAAGQAVVHSGYSSVYTVDASNGHLQETYLPAMGDPWTTQDLSANYGTPAVMAGTEPVAVVHGTYTSVYTVDASSGDLQETYLPAIGDAWSTQNLSANYGTPQTDTTPTAVYHSNYTSVYTVDESNGDLQETYLPAIGDPWTTQNLSANYGTPAVRSGTAPVSIVHGGYTSVYTVDPNDNLQETYLPAIGDAWTTQDLSTKYGTPTTATSPTVLVHDGYTSVYTVDTSSNDLQETYLPAIGDAWTSQNLSTSYGTPTVMAGTAPAALFHTGYASVYTVDASNSHLQETYQPSVGGPYNTQDLSNNYGTPPTALTPITLLHPDTSGNLTWTSVYTIDESTGDLQETYLPVLGDPWTTQNLSANYGTPAVYQ
jgi:hypothetical protein